MGKRVRMCMSRSLFSRHGLGSLEGRTWFLAMAVCLRAGLSGIIVIILMSEQILFSLFFLFDSTVWQCSIV